LDKKILVGVEHVLLAQAFEKILRANFYDVHLANPSDLPEAINAFYPDIAILEVPLSQLHELASRELSHRPPAKLVYLSADISAQTAAAAFRLGASAYVLKQAGVDEMLLALKKVAGKGRFLSTLISKLDVEILLNNRLKNRWSDPLTSRQLEVLQLFAQGLTMKEVASTLNVAVGTVAFHKYGMMERLNLTTNADFIRYGIMRCATQ